MFSNLVRFVLPAAAAASALALIAGAGATGVTGPAFFVHGELYRTVGTPTDFSSTGAPAGSYDVIYAFGGGQQPAVATAAPGDRGFNGGRWQVHLLNFSDYAGALADGSVDMNANDVLDSAEEVQAAIDLGYAVDAGVVKMFECPVIPVPRH
jgi:hypothetical protein